MKYIIAFLSIAIFVVLLVVYINISKPVGYYDNLDKKQDYEINLTKSFVIKKPKFSYFFPARLLYMKIDFKSFKYILIYKITLSPVDKFAFFNVKTILDNYNIHYSLLQRKKTQIYIFFRSLNEANTVLNLFKEYNFKIKIKKIKKRI